MRLDDRTAVVTGGGTGIGLAIARALAAAGCQVAIAGRTESRLQQAAASWTRRPSIRYHTVDVSDRDSVTELFRWADRQLGRIDILVNSAGLNVKKRSMAELRPEEWDRVMGANVTGAFNCLHSVLPGMRQRKDGVIININSIAGLRSNALGGVAYSASKFGMTALGTAVNNEDCVNGIRVTNVYPGEVNTPILDSRPEPVSDEHKSRILQPEDFGDVVVAICCLPPRANVSDIVIKPTLQQFV